MPTTEQVFLQRINAHTGILRKVVQLYVDDPDDRRDLQQEILLQAWKAYPAFREESRFSTWLYRISLNTVMTFRRRAATRPKTDFHPALDIPAPETDSQEDTERLYRAVRRLPDAERALVLLQLDGYSLDDISGITGLTKNHVSVKLHRIKNDLSKYLKA